MSNIYRKTQIPIKDEGDLIGRTAQNGELTRIMASLDKGTSIELIGERRSGKTSLIHCAVRRINRSNKKKTIAFQINFKSHSDFQGQNEGYLLLASYFLFSINKVEDIWDDNHNLTLRRKKISKQKSIDAYIRYFENSKWASSQILFKALLEKFINNGYKIYLFIDEYEFMVKHTFKSVAGALHPLRDCMQNHHDFCCIIAGAVTWDVLAQDIGSDDLNLFDYVIYVGPLSKQNSEKFVDQAFSDFNSTPEQAKVIKEIQLQIFDISGGMPYLLTLICNDFEISGNFSVENLSMRLTSHFNNIWSRLQPNQKIHLKGKKNKYFTDTKKQEMVLLGLTVNKKNLLLINQTIPNGLLWKKFVDTQIVDQIRIEQSEPQKEKILNVSPTNIIEYQNKQRISQAGETIIDFIDEINDNLSGKNMKEIFDLRSSSNWAKIFSDIRKICYSSTEFGEWICNLYLIVVEATTDQIKDNHGRSKSQGAARYPDSFNRKYGNAPNCFYRIGALRHDYKLGKAHNTSAEFFDNGKFTKADTLEFYLGNRNNPKSQSDEKWFKLQLAICNDFTSFLAILRDWSEDQLPVYKKL